MITSFRHSEDIDKHIIKTSLDHTASWINVVEPDREEIENLMEQYNIPEDFIRDPLDSEESSRIEYDEDTGYSLIIIDLPIVNSTNRSVLSFVTIPLGIIIGNGIIVTVCDAENEFLENLPKRDINLKFHSRFALEILTTIADHYNRNLRLLNKSRIRIEKELKNNITNKQLFKLMEVEKSLVYFLAALKGNDTIIKKLFRLPAIKRFEEDEE
ncbi:TPA: magnesium transporter CorA family protein, partial [Staphylococcus aureus]